MNHVLFSRSNRRRPAWQARLAPECATRWLAGLLVASTFALAGCAGQTSSSVLASPTGSTADGRNTARTDVATASDVTDIEKRARIRLELAAEYFSQGQTAVALDEVKQALAANPNLPQAHNLRGLIYAGMNEFDLAEDSFRRALALNARDPDTLHNYGWYLCQRNRHAEAVAMFARALAVPQYPDRARTLLAEGVCEARAGDFAAAERTLLKAYEIDPANPATAVNLADVLYRRGEYERARFYVKRVNAVEQMANAETLWLAARIENKLGNRPGSDEYGQKLKQRYPRSREAARFEQRRFDE